MAIEIRNQKLDKLKSVLLGMKNVLVAYSGGCDSTFLLKVALDALGNKNVLAVIASSATYPESEVKDAVKLCRELGANHLVLETSEMDDERFTYNNKDRCYFCKMELFSKLKDIATERNIPYVVDGSNSDDIFDYRPGARAKAELSILSPLEKARLNKSEIRELSRELGLPTWGKPALACLASRIPYGTSITKEILSRIDSAEKYLYEMGFDQVRVRHHGNLARIEVGKDEMPKIIKEGIMDKINRRFGELGYIYVTIDLKGYRTGSLNEEIKKNA